MRAFIALEVPEEIKSKAEALENDFRADGITLVKKDAMHITMQFLGGIDAAQAEKVVEAMKSVSSRPFRVGLSGVSYFTPRLIRVIFVKATLGEKELQELYRKLSDALRQRNISFEAENYVTHLTLARVKRAKDMRGLRDALEKNANTDLGTFDVRSIALKESTLTPEGPEYRTLYEVML